jgi:transposase, IS5 family
MLRLSGGQVESLFDRGLPIEVRELPTDLAALDRLLEGTALLEPIGRAWDPAALTQGRPTIPMDRFVRLMLVKQRSGWGYETLVREVSDSLHLRRFCLIPLAERVPDESTIRKLARRPGPEVIEEICRALILQATTGPGRFVARAARIDSTVVEADVRYPTDLGLCADGAGSLAAQAARAAQLAGPDAPRVVNRTRAVNKRLRALNRTLARRTGQGAAAALRLTEQAGTIVARSIRESRRLVARLRACARGRGAGRKLAAAARLEQTLERAERVCGQVRQRVAGQRIPDRLVSLADPDARPIRKGKLRQPNEFGYVFQLAELTESTRRGSRGLILPAATRIGAAAESDLLPATGAEIGRLGLHPREVALDGGFFPSGVAEHLPAVQRALIAGRQSAGSRRTNRRLARYRLGCEGRISHLKRRYGLRRSRLRGHPGARTWVAWGVLAYNLDTLAIRSA